MANAFAKPLGLELTAQTYCVNLHVGLWDNATKENATAERVSAGRHALSLVAPTSATAEAHVSMAHASAPATSLALIAVSSDALWAAASMASVRRTTPVPAMTDGLAGRAMWSSALATAPLWVCATMASATVHQEDKGSTAPSSRAPMSARATECAREECASVRWDGTEMTAARVYAPTSAQTTASACTVFCASAARAGKVRTAVCPHARTCARSTASATRGCVHAMPDSTELTVKSSTAPMIAQAMASAAMAHARASLAGKTLTAERLSTSSPSTVL